MIKIEMKFKKMTKGTVVYEQIDFEDNTEKSVPSVYIRKTAFETGKFPKHITMVIEAVE